jgi:predicted RNA-binding Zn ribbon-like protein
MLYPPDWVRAADGAPATDLELAVLLVNSLDALAEPADRLHTIDWYAEVLTATGHPGHAAALRPEHVPGLRALRGQLRSAFTATDGPAAARALNPALLDARAVPVLVPDPGGAPRLAVAPGETGWPALRARLPAALAAHIDQHGLRRLGTCAASPCDCAFVDHTRAASRRYCCDLCNDRASAAAYRRRAAST